MYLFFQSFFFSPFEPFKIFFFSDCLGRYLVSSVTVSLFNILVLISLFFFFILFSFNFLKFNFIFFIVSRFFNFIKVTVEDHLPEALFIFQPFLYFIFLWIFASNFFGLIPYSFVLTSHIVLIFILSLVVFFLVIFLSFGYNGLSFFKFFCPSGVPPLLLSFIILIEIISYVFRVISLSVRLFANILAGHLLLKILSCFTFLLFVHIGKFFFLGFFPFLIIFCIFFLELFVSFLQAYVYLILCVIYLRDVFALH